MQHIEPSRVQQLTDLFWKFAANDLAQALGNSDSRSKERVEPAIIYCKNQKISLGGEDRFGARFDRNSPVTCFGSSRFSLRLCL